VLDEGTRGQRPLVVRLPAEIDVSNADDVLAQITAALSSGVATVIVDLTATCFCDSVGLRHLMRARDQAAAEGAQLRMAIAADGQVRRMMELTGFLHVLPIYPTLQHAIDGRWHAGS
jgi:anti-sigma B factor antagonist